MVANRTKWPIRVVIGMITRLDDSQHFIVSEIQTSFEIFKIVLVSSIRDC